MANWSPDTRRLSGPCFKQKTSSGSAFDRRNRGSSSAKNKSNNNDDDGATATATNDEEDTDEEISHVNPPSSSSSSSSASSFSYVSPSSAKFIFPTRAFKTNSNQVVHDLREAQKLMSQYKHNDPINSITTRPDPDLPEISNVLANRWGVKSKSPRGTLIKTGMSNSRVSLLVNRLTVNKRSSTARLTAAVSKKTRLAEARPSSKRVDWTPDDEIEDDLEETVSEVINSNDDFVDRRISTGANNTGIEADNNQVPKKHQFGALECPTQPVRSKKKSQRNKWNQEEEDALCDAVKKYIMVQ